MAKQVLGPATQITVNGIDLSTWCTQVALEDSKDKVEVTGFAESYREFLPGLKDAELSATFVQDYASNTVDATLSAMYSATTSGTIKVKPDTSGTVVYTLVGRLYSYGPVSGAVGDANTIEANWANDGTAGLTRGTT